jgi:hypothetical protein
MKKFLGVIRQFLVESMRPLWQFLGILRKSSKGNLVVMVRVNDKE